MHIAKIKKFLFKIIHNISVCGEILFRWKTPKNVFTVIQRIIHLSIWCGNVLIVLTYGILLILITTSLLTIGCLLWENTVIKD